MNDTVIEHKRLDIAVEFKALPGEVLLDGVPGIYIEGYASVREPSDRYGDVIGPTDQVFREAVLTYFQLNPILLYEHGLDAIIGNKPLGQTTAYRFDDYGLWIKAFVRRPVWQPLLQVYLDIKAGILRTFSIGGIWTRAGNEIVKADLFEISVVATPAQPFAVFELSRKSFSRKDAAHVLAQFSQRDCSREELKKLTVVIASANLDYWQDCAKRALKAKYRTQRARKLALAQALKRLQVAESNFQRTISNLC